MLARYVALISALGFLTSVATSNEQKDKEWWETTLVYQIWPRGFRDSDGDGEGDLKGELCNICATDKSRIIHVKTPKKNTCKLICSGVISQLDYLKDLGIETIWLNSIYESPFIDSGFDVSDFKRINPRFGTLQDFDNLVQEVHRRGMITYIVESFVIFSMFFLQQK